MNKSEIDLIELELKKSETKIELINDLLEHGTIEHKINFILSDIREKEMDKELDCKQKLRLEEMKSYFFAGIKV